MESEGSSKVSQYLGKLFALKNLDYVCCRSRRDVRLFSYIYLCLLIILFILFMVAFLLPSSTTIYYYRWYGDHCSIDVTTKTPMMECDHSLRLFCSKVSERCSCLENMFWNGSFCDCSPGMFYSGIDCQPRGVFGHSCRSDVDSCQENFICSSISQTCVCPSTSYYNQTDCVPRFGFNTSQSCSLSSQCVDGLVCRYVNVSSNQCLCPVGQSWNGTGCSNASTYGEYCTTSLSCASSSRLICNANYTRCTCNSDQYWDGEICRSRLTNGSLCNNTQQCRSELFCIAGYCQCPLINSQYWSSQSSTCELCVGIDLFLYDGICYHIPVPLNATRGTQTALSSIVTLSTIDNDRQLIYLFNQYIRVFNWIPIFFSAKDFMINHFHWLPDQSVIKPTYFCNDTLNLTTAGYVLALKLETNTPCLRAWPNQTIGQLAYQLNTYAFHVR